MYNYYMEPTTDNNQLTSQFHPLIAEIVDAVVDTIQLAELDRYPDSVTIDVLAALRALLDCIEADLTA